MAWIKIDHTTLDKPEVMQIAERLAITPEQAFGHLCRVWVWADQQSLNGHAISVTEKGLDRVAGHAGFVTAMREVGWLKGKDGGFTFPNFDNHNGETAKKRALAYKRQVTHRSRPERDISVTRIDKKREERKTQNNVGLRHDAEIVLDFLNSKTGRNYEAVAANLELILARLKEGASVDDLRAVVAKKCREWTGDEKMAQYLRPATLFNRTKFAQYKGELSATQELKVAMP